MNAIALYKEILGRGQRQVDARSVVAPSSRSAGEIIAPYLRPGYKSPERMTALDYVTPKAKFPLVWLMDIGGYDAVSNKNSGQATLSLTSAHQGGAQARLQCTVPLHEGRLFEKEGTYVVVVVPADDEDAVKNIMEMAGQK